MVSIRMVAPMAVLRLERHSISMRADFESSAPVGSTASIRAGSFIIARAAATLWRWPPDIS